MEQAKKEEWVVEVIEHDTQKVEKRFAFNTEKAAEKRFKTMINMVDLDRFTVWMGKDEIKTR